MSSLNSLTTSTDSHPIWALVRAGLDDIETQEAELQKRLLDSAATENDLSESACQMEWQRIISRTDRVRRMLQAMSPLLNAAPLTT